MTLLAMSQKPEPAPAGAQIKAKAFKAWSAVKTTTCERESAHLEAPAFSQFLQDHPDEYERPAGGERQRKQLEREIATRERPTGSPACPQGEAGGQRA